MNDPVGAPSQAVGETAQQGLERFASWYSRAVTSHLFNLYGYAAGLPGAPPVPRQDQSLEDLNAIAVRMLNRLSALPAGSGSSPRAFPELWQSLRDQCRHLFHPAVLVDWTPRHQPRAQSVPQELLPSHPPAHVLLVYERQCQRVLRQSAQAGADAAMRNLVASPPPKLERIVPPRRASAAVMSGIFRAPAMVSPQQPGPPPPRHVSRAVKP